MLLVRYHSLAEGYSFLVKMTFQKGVENCKTIEDKNPKSILTSSKMKVSVSQLLFQPRKRLLFCFVRF